MAIIHRATIDPTKPELVAAWLPTQRWVADPLPLTQVGAFRFDDPDGEVGVEVLVFSTAGGRLLQVPLSYRAAPLAGVDPGALLGTTEHSVLGTRWVYDGLQDPLVVALYASAVLGAVPQAEEIVHDGAGGEQQRQPTVHVAALGGPTGAPVVPVPSTAGFSATVAVDPCEIVLPGVVVTVHRVLDLARPVGEAPTLVAQWAGQESPVVLAQASIN